MWEGMVPSLAEGVLKKELENVTNPLFCLNSTNLIFFFKEKSLQIKNLAIHSIKHALCLSSEIHFLKCKI